MRKHPRELPDPRPAIWRQKRLVIDIFNAKENQFKHLFGFEWLICLILSASQFFFPTLYIRHFLGKKLYSRKIWIERWALFKPILLSSFLFLSIFNNIVMGIALYFLLDLYLYLLGLVFLSHYYSAGISRTRNILLLQVNCVESSLGFSLLYMCLDCLHFSDGKEVSSAIDALYFTLITATTVGFGDIASYCRAAVILQVVCSFLFISVVLTTFLNKEDKDFSKK